MQQQQTNNKQTKTKTRTQRKPHKNSQNKIKIFVANFGHLYFRSGRFSETMKDRGISSLFDITD
jgi:hypothetical protein